jgi:Putative adhesin
MAKAPKYSRISTALVSVFPLLSVIVFAQEKKEFSYTVGLQAVISITNNYGPITVRSSGNRQVVVTTVSHSDTVSFDNEQHGNRIELRSVSTRPGSSLVDFTVLVPGDALVSLRSSGGTLHAQGLRGDVILQAETATVEASDISEAHLHVKTLSGPIKLADIRNSTLDVRSVSGNVNIHNVTGSSVDVNSGHGRIDYDGDPGPGGEYKLVSHSGDLEISKSRFLQVLS